MAPDAGAALQATATTVAASPTSLFASKLRIYPAGLSTPSKRKLIPRDLLEHARQRIRRLDHREVAAVDLDRFGADHRARRSARPIRHEELVVAREYECGWDMRVAGERVRVRHRRGRPQPGGEGVRSGGRQPRVHGGNGGIGLPDARPILAVRREGEPG